MNNKPIPSHIEFPEKFRKIVTNQQFLEQPSYQMDVAVEGFTEMINGIIRHTESILYIDPEKGNVDGNTIGFGLAACQLEMVRNNEPPALLLDEGEDNHLKPLNAEGFAPRFGVIRVPDIAGNKPLELDMINPQIIKMATPRSYKGEGCLSFPGQWRTTLRNRYVQLGFIDAHTLKPRELELYGLDAVILQHELDHHEGVLFFHHERKPVTVDKKIGANDPCPCLSGKKYKKCCGD